MPKSLPYLKRTSSGPVRKAPKFLKRAPVAAPAPKKAEEPKKSPNALQELKNSVFKELLALLREEMGMEMKNIHGEPGEPGQDGSPDGPDQVVQKVNSAKIKVEKSAINGLEKDLFNLENSVKAARRVRSGGPGGGGGNSSGSGDVDSVNGQTGVVVLDTGDIGEAADANYVTDAQLTLIAALDADLATFSLPASTTISAFGASVIDDADEATFKATVNLEIGTDVQAFDAFLDDIAALTDPGANAFLGWDDGAGAMEFLTQAEARTVLGLGTAALVATDLSDLNEATIEAAIDTLANLVSIQGRTVTLADAGSNAFFGWDDAAGAYENLTAAEAEAIIEPLIDTLANLTSIQGRTVTLTDAGADAILGWDDTANAYENLTATEVMAVIGSALDISNDTTPQLGGVLDANGFGITDVHAIQLDGTPDVDHTANGPQTNTFAAGYSSAIGDLVFFGSGGKWLEVDSDAVATCKGLLGIALEAKTDTQAMLVALPGSFVRDDSWNWTVGDTLYAGETLGAMQNTIPTGADAIIKVVGFAVSADVIFFNPSPDQQSTVA